MSATWQLADTIAALASPPGPAPRGTLRLSGPAALATFRDWFVPHAAPPRASTHPPVPAPDAGAPGNDGDSHSPPDQACDPAADPPPDHPQAPLPWDARTRAWRTEGSLSLPALFDPLEVALHCWPGRRSYTGEPVVEVHTLGSPVLLNLLLEELFARGVRPARPGEFTLRAFLAGRLDLTQAEAVLGVIDADSPAELHAALQQLAGGVSREFDHLRADLLDLLADLEAGLDFADEEIEFITPTQLADRLEGALRGVVRVAGQARDRQRDSARWRVVLAGPPNAGKSTLFNALAGQAAALVSPEAGTTRDWLARDLDLAGLPVTLVDTAGHEPAHDEVSRLSQARQAEQVARADLLLWCLPADGVGAELARRLAGASASDRLAPAADSPRAGTRRCVGASPLGIAGARCAAAARLPRVYQGRCRAGGRTCGCAGPDSRDRRLGTPARVGPTVSRVAGGAVGGRGGPTGGPRGEHRRPCRRQSAGSDRGPRAGPRVGPSRARSGVAGGGGPRGSGRTGKDHRRGLH